MSSMTRPTRRSVLVRCSIDVETFPRPTRRRSTMNRSSKTLGTVG